jgi:3',5'-cyclic AMP phosphodiesterase CpdA
MNRRSFLAGSLPAASVALGASALTDATGAASAAKLKCGTDGTFKILAISDLHHTPEPDEPGRELVGQLISTEGPDIVIVNGDCISGDTCSTVEDLKLAISHVAAPMEQAETPWAITFGNHDQDHFARTRIEKAEVLSYYESYPHNRNAGWARGLHGAGNANLLVWDADGLQAVFNLWLIDSGGRPQNPDDQYDWIHADQVNWYCQTSLALEKQYGRKIPGLLFCHIPLPEFHTMIESRKIVGERHEPESPSMVNGGMFAAVLERGDVQGIFCGHDHVNNYLGLWHGVELGYDGIGGVCG